MQNQTQSKNQGKVRNQTENGMDMKDSGKDLAQSTGAGVSTTSTGKETGMKSIGTVIGENLARGTQERVDKAMDTVSGYVESVKDYVTENPKEAAALAASIGLAAWALFYTKPGRRVFDKGAAVIVPEVSKWVTETFSGASEKVAQH